VEAQRGSHRSPEAIVGAASNPVHGGEYRSHPPGVEPVRDRSAADARHQHLLPVNMAVLEVGQAQELGFTAPTDLFKGTDRGSLLTFATRMRICVHLGANLRAG
jgi:hypothetical protein